MKVRCFVSYRRLVFAYLRQGDFIQLPFLARIVIEREPGVSSVEAYQIIALDSSAEIFGSASPIFLVGGVINATQVDYYCPTQKKAQ